MTALAFTALGYLLGTFPSAVLIARANGVDIERFGSGNPGASNVTRALGWRKGVWVYALDATKGVVAAGIGHAIGGLPLAYLCGAAAIIGHMFPASRGLRGGKGVATGSGVLLVVQPILAPIAVATWWILTRLTGKAAIGSVVAVGLVPAGMLIEGAPPWEFAAVAGVCALKRAPPRREPAPDRPPRGTRSDHRRARAGSPAMSDSIGSRRSIRSIGSIGSIGSVGSIGSIGSVGSIASIGSAGSIASIGSVGSIASIGSSGSIGAIGSAGSIGTVGTAGTAEPIRVDRRVLLAGAVAGATLLLVALSRR